MKFPKDLIGKTVSVVLDDSIVIQGTVLGKRHGCHHDDPIIFPDQVEVTEQEVFLLLQLTADFVVGGVKIFSSGVTIAINLDKILVIGPI